MSVTFRGHFSDLDWWWWQNLRSKAGEMITEGAALPLTLIT